MNDRYKELAMQATEWCIANADGTPTAWGWEKKLVELVVAECAHVAARAVYPENNEIVLETIKRHFGIEE